MYKQVKNTFGEVVAVQRQDGWQIPLAEDNTDYQAYLAWVAEGHEPLPPDDQTGQNTPIQE
jgi:hypothetical protein